MPMNWRDFFELASFVVTVIGLPFAAWAFYLLRGEDPAFREYIQRVAGEELAPLRHSAA
jgi:hypothetical protein